MAIILPFILFLFSGFTSILIKNKKVLSAIFILISGLALGCGIFLLITINSEVSYMFGGFPQEIGIEYTANPFKLTILTFILVLIFIFSIFFNGFIRNFEKDFNFNLLFCLLQIMCGACIAIILTNDLFNFYIFFELLSICTYILISLGRKGAAYASFNYLLLGIIASGFLVIGIGFLYFSTGYLNISKVAHSLQSGIPIKLLVPFSFILIGFLIKLAIFPFSFWPAFVYKYFPPSILPLYAGIVSIVTFYGFFLLSSKFFLLEAESMKNLILVLCSTCIILLSLFGLFENDVKKIFAYSTINQVAYAFFAIFFGTEALTSYAFLHLASNGISKFALFIILFEVLKNKQSSAISCLDGFASRSKFVGIAMLFFCINIVGLPITLGFFTKMSFILNFITLKEYPFIAVILLGAVLNFVYFWRIINVIFFKKRPDNEIEPFQINIESKIAITMLVLMIVAMVIFFVDISSILQINLSQFYL